MKREPIAYEAFHGTSPALIKFSRVGSQLIIFNDGKCVIKFKAGIAGRYFHEFIVLPDDVFAETLDPFTELSVEAHPVDALDMRYHGYPRRNGW